MITPYGTLPHPRQLAWHRMKFYGFVHFTVNSFTQRQWGHGDEPESIFAPTALDCRQWACVAKSAGMKGLILTAKHHDGFCLWPSKFTEHSVKNSPWKNGKGDVVREFVDACAEFGIKAGLYLSPWDRNHAEYGREAYVTYYHNQLEELMTQYGPLFEVWFDGAQGGDGYYGGARDKRHVDNPHLYYQFDKIWEIVRKFQPDACMFSDAGPDIRWCGNESGYIPLTCWNAIRSEGFQPGHVTVENGANLLGHGEPDGDVWHPPEVDVSIRPSWFWDPAERPRSLEELKSIYLSSVERGGNLHLNLPPDNRGLIADEDIHRLMELNAFMRQCEANDVAAAAEIAADTTLAPEYGVANLTDGKEDTVWAAAEGAMTAAITATFKDGRCVNAIRLEEAIEYGQRITHVRVYFITGWGQWCLHAEANTVGTQRVLRFPPITCWNLRIEIDALAAPVLRRLAIHTS